MTQEFRAFYSEEQRKRGGLVVYEDPEGNEVICTSVSRTAKPSSHFPDTEDRGPVVRFVRRIEPRMTL